MKIDMHVHSKYSGHSNLEISTIAQILKRKGLDGFALTDHNTTRGWKQARKVAKETGITFIPSCEIKTDAGEVIGYHMTKEVKSTRFEEVLKELHSQGAKISIPHFQDYFRFPEAVLNKKRLLSSLKYIDYIELNGRAFPLFNYRARCFANRHNLHIIAGSDAHWKWELGSFYTDLTKNKVHIGYNFMFLINMTLTKMYKYMVKQ
ncbi:PHP domain-containing protein [Candidatus Woesearchaeota archaeon]|jgi:predicted metal-dependent phosphoesterase TrpH|nr:PHP domain-containing protein [Candidatus Woesearchaeota archaeon]MBT4114136.1 PHP domain-containing protein [Candidatus Woesearchaeota archaeon]MBT4248421.1 PHP domain-containing protein [Candidatus Woesearchaeota archaeon]